jgi:hypothetical protein
MEKNNLENISIKKELNNKSQEEKTSSFVEIYNVSNNKEKVDYLEEKIELIVAKVDNLKPEKISPDWIKNKCGEEYYLVKDKFRTLEGEINWQLFADLLPKNLRNIWSYEKQRTWDNKKAKDTIVSLLKKEKPVTFNAEWIKNRDFGLYKHLRRKLKNKETNKIEWEEFINEIPEEWQEKWVRGFSKEGKIKLIESKRIFTFDLAVKKLNKILEEKNPAHFLSSDIKRFDKQLYSYFKENIKRKKGGIDWEKIIKKIDEKFVKRFRPPKRFEDEYPENRYENQNEVEELLNSNKEGVLGFFGGDRGKRDEFCLELVGLAKKGNVNAEEKLAQYLEMLTMDWIEKDEMFKVYEVDIDGLRERITRCIYLYKDNQPTSFIGYVYANLREEAKGKRYEKIELDAYKQGKRGRGGEGHEIIDLYKNLSN